MKGIAVWVVVVAGVVVAFAVYLIRKGSLFPALTGRGGASDSSGMGTAACMAASLYAGGGPGAAGLCAQFGNMLDPIVEPPAKLAGKIIEKTADTAGTAVDEYAAIMSMAIKAPRVILTNTGVALGKAAASVNKGAASVGRTIRGWF